MKMVMHEGAVRGWKDARREFGHAMLIMASVLMVFALGALAFKTWILVSWPRTTGTVVDSVLTMKKFSDGTTGCAAVEKIQYFVEGQSLLLRIEGGKPTQNCTEVEAQLNSLRGQTRRIAYDKRVPEATYINPGFNAGFYRDAVILGRIAVLLGIMGWAAIQSHRWRLKREAGRT